ncbi:uncharacterized protein N7483_003024 [Penicillium malachiteum]|uniref:uncharacterized protein n=1 Tax=Penicillium malachiteum TaxID=1324776 RepID=UPI0025474E9B|nr:uncharacterized protein N7483_003024 [Penicillium malachiteum]KAJ5737899.1 hypothetical protein N7483_003024 [Penicillium malachiteum]
MIGRYLEKKEEKDPNAMDLTVIKGQGQKKSYGRKETRACYNYRRTGYLARNYREKKKEANSKESKPAEN